MSAITIILIVGVALLYLKWVVIAVCCPLMWFYKNYMHHKTALNRLLAAPFIILNRKIFPQGSISRYVLYHVGLMPFMAVRKAIYRMLGVKMGKNVRIHFRCEVRGPHYLEIGDGTIIGDNAILDGRRHLKIGRNVNLASNTSIYTGGHDHRDPYFRSLAETRKMDVEIKDRVYLGSNVIVLPGVTIGEGAVCCAGCVVTKDVEPYAVVAGIPAKKVGERSRDLRYEFKCPNLLLF